MPRDPDALQAWYRDAMRRRIDELRELRTGLWAHASGAFDAARAVGQALRGSGSTFGFPEVTAVATLLETSADGEVLRRVEGLITALFAVADGSPEAPPPCRAEWLLAAADLPTDSDLLEGVTDIGVAWERVSAESGLDYEALAAAAARYLDVPSAVEVKAGRSACRLVPSAVMSGRRMIPLSEDAECIQVATGDPTSLELEVELRRLTGRPPRFWVASPERIDEVLRGLGEGPSAVAPALRPTEPPALPPPGRVLVVDDDESSRFMVRRVLEANGHEVAEAGDGLEALESLRDALDVGLVVADLHMPRMDGLDLIWSVRGDRRLADTPVIVVTGEVDQVLETQLLEEGADDYLRKPVDARLLTARVDAVLRRRGAGRSIAVEP